MDKPASKAALLQNIRDEHKRLEQSFKGISVNDMIKATTPGEWSVLDILAHVTAWERNLLKWYETGLRGEKQVMPQWDKPGVIDEINRGIYRQNHDRWLKEVLREFKESYKKTFKAVKKMPEDGMFTPGKYDWTGQVTLADYIVSNTSGHYAEHVPMIEALKQKYGF